MFIIGFFGYFIFQIACALAPNTASILVFRFLSGCFAACPLTNSGAVLGDIWDPETRGTATAIFTLAPFAGPAIGPIAGGYIAVSGIKWQWLFWILTIFVSVTFDVTCSVPGLTRRPLFFQSGVCWLVVVFTMKETYAPVILVQKAKKLRQSTGDKRYKAALELQEDDWKTTVGRILGRPWKIFFVEGYVSTFPIRVLSLCLIPTLLLAC
jgi:MFS family permease